MEGLVATRCVLPSVPSRKFSANTASATCRPPLSERSGHGCGSPVHHQNLGKETRQEISKYKPPEWFASGACECRDGGRHHQPLGLGCARPVFPDCPPPLHDSSALRQLFRNVSPITSLSTPSQPILDGRKRKRCNRHSTLRDTKTSTLARSNKTKRTACFSHRQEEQQFRSPAQKDRAFTFRFRLSFHLRRKTEPVPPHLPCVSRLLPARLLDFSCAPLTALVALRLCSQLVAHDFWS